MNFRLHGSNRRSKEIIKKEWAVNKPTMFLYHSDSVMKDYYTASWKHHSDKTIDGLYLVLGNTFMHITWERWIWILISMGPSVRGGYCNCAQRSVCIPQQRQDHFPIPGVNKLIQVHDMTVRTRQGRTARKVWATPFLLEQCFLRAWTLHQTKTRKDFGTYWPNSFPYVCAQHINEHV